MTEAAAKAESEDWYQASAEGVRIKVRAKPRSSRSGLDGVREGSLWVRVRSAPVDGKANRELTETLAAALGLAKSQVALLRGDTAKTKVFELRGMTPAALLEALAAATGGAA